MAIDYGTVRIVVDPLLMKLRQELFGSGVSFGRIYTGALPTTTVVVGGGGGTIDPNSLGFIKGIATYSGGTLKGSLQTEISFLGAGLSVAGARTTVDYLTPLNAKITNPMTTAGDIIYATTAGVPIRRAIGSAGQVLTVTAGIPTWETVTISGLLDPTTTVGDIIYRSAGGITRLPLGGVGQLLTVSGGLPIWADPVVASGTGSGGTLRSNTWASPPSSPNDGDIWVPPDSPYIAYRISGAWDYRHGSRKINPPALQGLTAVNQGAATFTDNGGSYHMLAPANATSNMRILAKSTPAATFKLRVGLLRGYWNVNFTSGGIIVRDSAGGRIINFALYQQDYTFSLLIQQYTGFTAGFSSTLLTMVPGYIPDYLEIEETASLRIFRVGRMGLSTEQIFSHAVTTWLTTNQCGIYVDSNNATYDSFIDVYDFTLT